MPELPDLVYLQKRMSQLLVDQQIVHAEVKQPVVLRMLLPGEFTTQLQGAVITGVRRHGPFLIFGLSQNKELVVHPMLAGKFRWAGPEERVGSSTALSLQCQPANRMLHYQDDKKMGKIYLTNSGEYDKIPRFNQQGPDLFSPALTLSYLRQQISKSRKQVRVLIMDQSVLSCIGNAYADEILFCAGIHPKTFCYQLDDTEIANLYRCIRETMQWGIDAVERAAAPLHVKVRDHMRVRNRKDQPCVKCKTKIRRAGVLGYDSFFCPSCQAIKRAQFIDWRQLDRKTD